MTHDKTKALTLITTGFIIVAMAMPGFGGTLTFSTYHSDITGPPFVPGHGLTAGQQDPAFTWNYTGNFADPRLNTNILAFNNNNQITICPQGSCGSENYGFGQTYAGYEFMYFGFLLPVDAVNIILHFSYATIDDRAVIDLNGHTLGGWGGTYSVAPGTTVQQLDGSGNHTVAFTGPPTLSSTDFSTQAWFNPGAENYIRFWINNTGTGINGTATPHGSYYDPSAMQTYGYIAFDQSQIPEPGTIVLAGLGLLAVGLGSRALRKS